MSDISDDDFIPASVNGNRGIAYIPDHHGHTPIQATVRGETSKAGTIRNIRVNGNTFQFSRCCQCSIFFVSEGYEIMVQAISGHWVTFPVWRFNAIFKYSGWRRNGLIRPKGLH